MKCPNCGADIPGNSEFCLFCGGKILVEAQEEDSKTIEPQEKGKKKKKSFFVIISVLIIAVIIGGFLYYQHRQEYKSEYEQDLRAVVLEMLLESTNAEKVISSYSYVWKRSIEGTIPIEQVRDYLISQFYDESIMENKPGYYVMGFEKEYETIEKGDFSRAIEAQRGFLEHIGEIEKLINSRDDISNKIRQLQNPPDEYKEAYKIVLDMYSSFDEFMSLAISPSGSLVDYNRKSNELSSDIITKIREIEIRIPIDEDDIKEIEDFEEL